MLTICLQICCKGTHNDSKIKNFDSRLFKKCFVLYHFVKYKSLEGVKLLSSWLKNLLFCYKVSKWSSFWGNHQLIWANYSNFARKKQIDMASNSDFVQYIADQCSGAGEIVTKKMFGDYGIYCDGKIFGLICDDRFYLKPTEMGRKLLRVVDMRPPYDGAKDYFYIADVDDRDYLSQLVSETCKELPMPKQKASRKK